MIIVTIARLTVWRRCR